MLPKINTAKGRRIILEVVTFFLLFLFVALVGAGLIGIGSGGALGATVYETLLALLTRYPARYYNDPISQATVIGLILCSYAMIAYLLHRFARYIIALAVNIHKFGVRVHNMTQKEHIIICSLDEVGIHAAEELEGEGVNYIVVDKDEHRVKEAQAQGLPAVQLDVTQEDDLKSAGIEHAKGIIVAFGDSSANLVVALMARSLNPEIFIVARANRPTDVTKLKHAGASKIVMPYKIGGYRMASMVMRPNVVDHMEITAGHNNHNELEVEEMLVGENSKLAGHHLPHELTDKAPGATVIAVNRTDGKGTFKPTTDEIVQPGDRFVVIGTKHELTAASDLIIEPNEKVLAAE